MVITFSLPEKQGVLSLQDALAALLHSEVRIKAFAVLYWLVCKQNRTQSLPTVDVVTPSQPGFLSFPSS